MSCRTTRIDVRTAVLAGLLLVLGGCAGSGTSSRPAPAPQPVTPAKGHTVGERAAVVAVRQVGVPYRYGGNSTSGFDCSGLVQFAYRQSGVSLPRTTAGLWRTSRTVAADDLRVGDLLFFGIAGKMSHVGLYLGSRRFVHAPSSGREVTIANLDADFYRRALLRAARPY